VSVVLAVLVTSVLFSAAHYAGAHGETFDWFSFSFRFLAGAFFALLFVYRGFGIAAGTHALYDIFVGVV
jgi:membrane protease YdiL (CAAX protease family)